MGLKIDSGVFGDFVLPKVQTALMYGVQAARKLAIAEVTLESFESRLEAAES